MNRFTQTSLALLATLAVASTSFAMTMEGDAMMKKDDAMMKAPIAETSMMKKDDAMMMKGDAMMMQKATPRMTVAALARKMGYNWTKDRAMLAEKAGITNYRGTRAQNGVIAAYLKSMKKDGAMMKEDAMMKKDDAMMMKNDAMKMEGTMTK